MIKSLKLIRLPAENFFPAEKRGYLRFGYYLSFSPIALTMASLAGDITR